jgi:short-subunit dehydrogenase
MTSGNGTTNGHGNGHGDGKASQPTAFITGASSGIGHGLALALARRGMHVIAAARRRDRLDQLVHTITGGGGSAEALVLDVADGDATYRAVRAADERRGLDMVVANAGVAGITPAKKLDWSRVRAILDTNVVGAAATLSAAVPGMVARGRGHLVAIASVAGFRGLPRFAAYSASKAALITFCESLRIDLHGSGVGVTTVCPGYVNTELLTPGKKHPFLVEVDDAVARILAAVDAGDAVCTFPAPTAAGMRAAQLLPRPLYEFLATRSKVKY